MVSCRCFCCIEKKQRSSGLRLVSLVMATCVVRHPVHECCVHTETPRRTRRESRGSQKSDAGGAAALRATERVRTTEHLPSTSPLSVPIMRSPSFLPAALFPTLNTGDFVLALVRNNNRRFLQGLCLSCSGGQITPQGAREGDGDFTVRSETRAVVLMTGLALSRFACESFLFNAASQSQPDVHTQNEEKGKLLGKGEKLEIHVFWALSWKRNVVHFCEKTRGE